MLFSKSMIVPCPYRQAIRDDYRISEAIALQRLLPLIHLNPTAKTKAWDRARQWVDYIRSNNKDKAGVDALLSEFSMSSAEGVVLMCLAEALLRVPDKKTQDYLIRDKITQGHWSSHLGKSTSFFVNASSWALLLTGKIVSYRDLKPDEQMGLLKKTVGRLGEPVIRRAVHYAMHIMGNQFVTGRNIQEALLNASSHKAPSLYSFDMLGEAARTMNDAKHYFNSYLDAIHAIGQQFKGLGPVKSSGISIKLSALHPRYEFAQKERVMSELVPKVKALALEAKAYDIGFTIDAEEADRLDISLDVIESVFTDPELNGWQGFGLAIQAYQKRALALVAWLKELSKKNNKKIMVRLVKGAYWDMEIKRSQQQGMDDFPVFTRKAATDVSYMAVAAQLLAARQHFYLQFATHNALTISSILELAGDNWHDFEFQRLHGMGESLYDKVLNDTQVPCRVYAPVGVHEALLAYLVRRLLENGANSSFVNAILDDKKSLDHLLADPVDTINQLEQKDNPFIAKPLALFSDERVNSRGLDISDLNSLIPLKLALDEEVKKLSNTALMDDIDDFKVINPADHSEILGSFKKLDSESMKRCIDQAEAAFEHWRYTDREIRCQSLLILSDLLEAHSAELIALCMKEAGKVLQDAIDEVREAVDFCRYYASQAKTEKHAQSQPRGIVLCISPWNFPLAIFLGQVSAALVMGNTVLAKPADQTVLVAKRTVELMYEAGFPGRVVQLVIADGEAIGRHVVTDQRIATVMFTGSTSTGQTIAKTLAQRPGFQVPLIAETGGQNCMIVDSTALLEQVVDDVIASGFQSAGQRCSALRVLYVQDDIADDLIELIIGAMQVLRVANPQWLSTDIGPVIDAKALSALNQHVDYLDGKAKLLYVCELVNMPASHYFFAPRLYEIDHISLLKQEVFGSCVHVIRFKGEHLHKVIEDINATGFGLTMGVHSRIEERAITLSQASKAGNIYINRNIIGAVVGVQPFGGHGLSGTGPKAGGPNYLGRLVLDPPEPHRVSCTEQPRSTTELQDNNEEISLMLEMAAETQVTWKQKLLSERILIIRRLAVALVESQQMASLTLDIDSALRNINTALNVISTEFESPINLPGPTGELNTLHYEPKGCILNYANTETSFSQWMTSLLIPLVLGNTVITIVSDTFFPEASAIFSKFNKYTVKGVIQLAKDETLPSLLKSSVINAVIISSECKIKSFINRLLSERSGAIVSVFNAESSRLSFDLLLEKTVSIDTTASGGNAELMDLND